MQFSVYYHSQAQGEYLRQVVVTSGIGQVRHFRDLSGLGGESETDVVLVEYQDNNPHLDNLIAQITKQPNSPDIFLFVEEVSPCIIWKALKLGARELFSRTIPAEDFQAALTRVELRHARLWQAHSEAGAWSELAGLGQGWAAGWGI
jgi:AmiR/NasT family two-component response regulator